MELGGYVPTAQTDSNRHANIVEIISRYIEINFCEIILVHVVISIK